MPNFNEHAYDQWKLSNGLSDTRIHAECDCCNNDIYDGDEYYKTDIGNFCDSVCFFDYCKEYHSGRYEKAGDE